MAKQLKNGQVAMEGINAKPNADIVMTITIHASGEFSMTGPMQNKLLSYAMLELARDSVQNYIPPDQLGIQPGSPADLQQLDSARKKFLAGADA